METQTKVLATATHRPVQDADPATDLSVADIRKINLRTLVAKFDGPSALAKKLGYSNGSYISQMIGPRPIRPLNEKTCRKMELKLGYPAMWMDRDHGRKARVVREEPGVYKVGAAELDSELLRAVAQAIEDAGIPYAAGKFGDVVTMLYEDASSKGGKIDAAYLVKVLRLAK